MTAVDLTPQFFSVALQSGDLRPTAVRGHTLLEYANDRYLVIFLVAANTARDVGGRLVAISIWGTKANGGRYAAIAALTNIVATVAAYAFYEFIFKDSSRGNVAHITIHAFLGLSILIVLVLTVIGKEHHDSKHRRYNRDNVTVRYGSGPDSEMNNHVENIEK